MLHTSNLLHTADVHLLRAIHHFVHQTYTLVGCTVAPGFDFADFEMVDRDELLRRFPAHAGIVARKRINRCQTYTACCSNKTELAITS